MGAPDTQEDLIRSLLVGHVIPPDAVIVSVQFRPGDPTYFLLFVDENLAQPVVKYLTESDRAVESSVQARRVSEIFPS